MTPHSLRVRLTTWYLAVLAPALLVLALGSWYLARQNVLDTIDDTLDAQIAGVGQFIANAEHEVPPANIKDEFGEYVDLTHGKVTLEVRNPSGAILVAPPIPGFAEVERDPLLIASDTGPFTRLVGGEPYRVRASEVTGHDGQYRVIVAAPLRSVGDALRHFGWILAGLVPLVLVIAGAGGYWVARRALDPVDQMTRAVRDITIDHLDRRLDVPAADDELRRLALTFNDMITRVQAALTEMSRLTAEASHELRTPVSLVLTTAEVALAKDRSADDYRAALTDVVAQANRLSHLVGDLLVLARADAGVEAPEPEIVDVVTSVRDAVRLVAPAAQKCGIMISCEGGEPGCRVLADPQSLMRLWVILLDNAIKYSHQSGTVRVRVGVQPDRADRVRVDIADEGLGLDAEDLPHLFDRFYRGARARHHEAAGSGLGLAIARTIVERASGDIALRPGPSGLGAVATVSLPLQP